VAIITDSKKQRALKLIAQGRVTVSEMGRLAGVKQQSMHTYARQAGIDPVAARRRYLEDLWRSETRPRPAANGQQAAATARGSASTA
jgi:transposase-like protein